MKTINAVNGFKYTTALRKLRRLKKRIKKVPGGTSAGKTYGILPILIDKATKNNLLEISVVSESIPHLRKGAIKDFIKIMKSTGRYIDSHWNRTLLTYHFATGSYIEFFSADQEDKVRGPRRNILYINECNNINFETYHQLAIRTDMEIWLDYNPTNEFWIHTELGDDEDSEEVVLTYKDNEGLSSSIVKEIEKALKKGFNDITLTGSELFKESNIRNSFWANWWRVYGLGQRGSLEGVIFNNWTTISGVPKEARLLGYGCDFGYTNDPTSIIEVYQYNDKRILNEICYRTGMVNGDIARVFSTDEIVYADSAEPKSIEEIKRYGVNIKGVTKGKDSINFGIQIMQNQSYLVTKNSTNLIKEFRSYCWAKDREGKTLNKPIDNFNHAIDAIRYHEMESIGLKQDFFVF
jgi:phage terminase large subunit